MAATEKVTHYEMDMCSGPILGKMLRFALPLMLSSILQLLFNAADVIVVGKFAGDNSLAAVGSNVSIISLLTNFFLGLSVGVNVMVARYYGAEDHENVHDTVQTAITISLISGVFLTFIGCLGAKQFLTWMKTPPEVLPLATLYLRIYFLGMTSNMVYNFGASILRAIGDTRRALYYLSFAGVINVILNLFFVIVMKLDVAGVAIATVISQTVSAALIIRCLTHESGDLRVDLRKLHITRSKLEWILRIGLPASVQSILFSFSNVIIQSTVNSFGAVTVAGSSAAQNIEGFVYVGMNAFYQSTLTFTGQNLGAGKHERINRILVTGLGCVAVTGLLLGMGAYKNGNVLLRLYTSSPEVVGEGLRRMKMVSALYFLCGMMDVMVGCLRGLGYSVMPMAVSLIGICVLRLGYIFTIFQLPAWHTPESLYMTYPISWLVTLTAHVICFIILRKRLEKEWHV